MSRPNAWSQGIASESVQMSIQSPIAGSSQFQESAYLPSFQPYVLQPQVMQNGQGLNFSATVGHHFGSPSVNNDGILLLHAQNDFSNAKRKMSIKITHPETKEELKLDELAKPKHDSGSAGTRAQYTMELQPQPFTCGNSHLVNYFPYMQPYPFSSPSPSPIPFSSMQMLPVKSRVNYLDYRADFHGAVIESRSEYSSSFSVPTSTELAFLSVGEKILSPVSVNSVVNDKSEAIKSRKPQRVGSGQKKSKIHSEIAVKPPSEVVIKPTTSIVSSHRAIPSSVSVEGDLTGERANGDGKKSVPMENSEYLSKPKEVQPVIENIHKKQIVDELRLPETSKKMEKGKPKDWKNFADISTPEFHISRKVELHQNMSNAASDSIIVPGKKRYSRDFLLTLSSQFVELPTDFELVGDMIKGILVSKVLDDLGYRVEDGSKRIKMLAPSAFAEELQFGNTQGNIGVHSRPGTYRRNLHGQTPDHCDGGFATSFLPRSSHSRTRNKCPEPDHWQQDAFLDIGLISSPQSPLQVMHLAEKKYKVHKGIDGEEAKQRQLKAILNKLTPQNFERLFQQVKEINIDNSITLSGLISQIFDKALMEPMFCEMYADFCYHLAQELPNFVEGREKVTFRGLLLNKCQEEFVRGERQQAGANIIEEGGEARLSEEEREEKRICARRRMLGNIRLLGELYKKKMLSERLMHDCIQKLLGKHDSPEEDDVEALCELMNTVGEVIDHPKAKVQMNACFEVMKNLLNNSELSSRMRFILKDVIDLRKNRWQQRRRVEGPKKIDELHIDAAQERRALVNRLTSVSNVNSSNKKFSANFSPRQSSFQSRRNMRVSTFHAMRSHVPGFVSQDVRLEDKYLCKQGTLQVPFPRRLSRGQHLGHAKKVSLRAPPMLDGLHTDLGKSRSTAASPNGFSSKSEQKQYNTEQHSAPRNATNIFRPASGYDQPNKQRNNHNVNRDFYQPKIVEN
ncbi:eukaryotic translation initiation factor 4G [Coffea arabica]|uniref:Eukaryotic translation initiation factor 4G n=1 Tax=Coffea arabica TaxID=13443 RepID=A0A6P6TYA6_COFAR|nr:eukaryotic translation initiation factor 4G-like [Coffea arabica]XP_027083257.1 eukaryotic translation initiation factor 4G-like [Coffea arabica]XP_027083258.1 eukaryotic translation initiation factor 4G-like [Coffea arabica]XP_027083259.1 eukaryotic translation initiation factor 4G-like [Coffea arabica]XP_027083260.1 eukaryotic translation initiation factor 4G-like [Coffea arabica]XP_027083261.1 eukaryotic translation initiation factor 4G-like [Coffea arabica]XP_027083263.1 eukaryotic tra